MTRLLITTSILTLGAISAGAAHGAEAPTVSPVEFSQAGQAVTTLSSATGLHTGDFQRYAKATKTHEMYRGSGGSLMTTTRMQTD